MSQDVLVASYKRGTERLRAPAETLARIQPMLAEFGITRCADVTWLDEIGVPVFCAIRPDARVLQVSNGKGLTRDDARVSALMESIELFHAEHPSPDQLISSSRRSLRESGRAFVEPSTLSGYASDGFDADDFQLDWTPGEDLATKVELLAPASAVFFHRRPSPFATSTNGLASGNHRVEATLHGLYEAVEREDAAKLLGQTPIPIRERCHVVALDSIDDPDLRGLVEKIRSASSTLILIRVESLLRLHTFWAVLLNQSSTISGSSFNTGWGTHHDLKVAACRAVTEAVQSRATMIHGAREDAILKPLYTDAMVTRESKAFRFFEALQGDASWHSLVDLGIESAHDLTRNLEDVIIGLTERGRGPIVRCDLTRPAWNIPVVKVLCPGLALHT